MTLLNRLSLSRRFVQVAIFALAAAFFPNALPVAHSQDEKVEEVRGEGVIGQQPEILPGQSFHYTSGAVIETKFGSMHGDYEMQSSSGEKFTAKIPPFLLAPPLAVH